MGTWEELEAEEPARAARIEKARESALEALVAAWPPHPIEPSGPAWADESGGNAFRDGVRGKTWQELPGELLDYHRSQMSFLGPAEFREVLPAWLAAAMGKPTDIQEALLYRLTPGRDVDRFRARFEPLTPLQRNAIAQVLDVLRLRWSGADEAEIAQLRETTWSTP
ncbi:MAG TPA: DUF6714 family protein [Kofleriaceae bacterium]|jgi:hypothetical protein